MTTLLVNIRDEQKANDVVRFLRDIDFLEVVVKDDQIDSKNRPLRRSPAKEILGTRIIGDIMKPVIADSDWEILSEPSA